MILIVEDHYDTRLVMQLLLRKEGYEVTGVENGADALRFLETHTPRLVILDFRMPDLNGLEVLAAMKANGRLAAVPVVMFSADDASVKEKALAAGVTAFIAKGSLDWAKLIANVVEIVGIGRQEDLRETALPPHEKKRSG